MLMSVSRTLRDDIEDEIRDGEISDRCVITVRNRFLQEIDADQSRIGMALSEICRETDLLELENGDTRGRNRYRINRGETDG